MEQQTGSNLGKKYVKSLYCHPAYLTYMQSTSCEMPGWIKPSWHIVTAMVFPVLRYGYESWIVKKPECWRIDAFELWCWRRLLRVFWMARRSNQSILKEISPEYSLEGLMLKLKLQYFGHLMWRTDLCWERLKAGREGDNRGWDVWMASPSQGQWFEQAPGVGDGQGSLVMLQSMGCKELATTEQLNLTKLSKFILEQLYFSEKKMQR